MAEVGRLGAVVRRAERRCHPVQALRRAVSIQRLLTV